MEYAKRGAHVTVLEASAHYINQGRMLADFLGLPATFVRGSIYELPALGRFEVVLFLGVIYHLHHPFYALDLVREASASRMFLSSRLNRSTSAVWAMSNVRGHRPDNETAQNWWLPSVDGMAASLDVYSWDDVELLHLDDDRQEGFWTAIPAPIGPLVGDSERPRPR